MNTKTETQHTPTPWILGETVISVGKRALLQMETTNLPYKANAAFIVRAVNSHEALLEAVKDLRYAFYVENSPKKLKEAFVKHADKLKEIIAQASGENK